MKNLALGAGIFIVIELLLAMLLAVDESMMIMVAAGVITLLSLILINQLKLVKSNRDRDNHQRKQKISELNQKSRKLQSSESVPE